MLLLAIDTSTPTVTAAVASLPQPADLIGSSQHPASTTPSELSKPVELLAEHTVTDAYAHAEQLMPLANAALAESGRRLAELDAIVVGLGPGPFTGLRVGIATAQALGDALDIAVHGVGSHDAAARGYLSAADPSAETLLVVTDARRREVYLSAYSRAGRRLLGPAPVAPSAVAALLAEHQLAPVEMIGAGAPLLDLPGVREVGTGLGSLSIGLILAAARALLTGAVPGPLAPLYLRRPDATEPGVRKSVLGR